MKQKITEILHEIHIPAHLRGHEYLREAIALCIEDPERVYNVMEGIYTTIAESHDTKPELVERAIRHAIRTGIFNTDREILQKYFVQHKVSNSEFIASIADRLRMEMEKADESKLSTKN